LEAQGKAVEDLALAVNKMAKALSHFVFAQRGARVGSQSQEEPAERQRKQRSDKGQSRSPYGPRSGHAKVYAVSEEVVCDPLPAQLTEIKEELEQLQVARFNLASRVSKVEDELGWQLHQKPERVWQDALAGLEMRMQDFEEQIQCSGERLQQQFEMIAALDSKCVVKGQVLREIDKEGDEEAIRLGLMNRRC
jgi:predicted transcriptional regulator